MQVMNIPPLPSPNTNHHRWSSRRHLAHWLAAFRRFFPRKAHLAEQAAARLAGCDVAADLYSRLESRLTPDEATERGDILFAQRRMVLFREDRLILVNEFGILPDAADVFLTACPVGCGQCWFSASSLDPFESGLSFYGDDQRPSERLPLIIEQQYQDALGQSLSHVDSTSRLGEYLHPMLLANLFQFLHWDVSFDVDGQNDLGPVPATSVGWIADNELGDVEVYALRFTAPPVWARDEVFWAVLHELTRTCDLANKPVVLLNNLPMQLVRGGHTYTSIGWLVIESKVMPLLISDHGHPLNTLLIELVTFHPETSASLADEGNVALSLVWSWLSTTSAGNVPSSPSFRALPDGWMLPENL